MREIVSKTMTCKKLLEIIDNAKDNQGRVNDLVIRDCHFTNPIKGLPVFEFVVKWKWEIISFGKIKLFMGHLLGKNVFIIGNIFD